MSPREKASGAWKSSSYSIDRQQILAIEVFYTYCRNFEHGINLTVVDHPVESYSFWLQSGIDSLIVILYWILLNIHLRCLTSWARAPWCSLGRIFYIFVLEFSLILHHLQYVAVKYLNILHWERSLLSTSRSCLISRGEKCILRITPITSPPRTDGKKMFKNELQIVVTILIMIIL